MIKSILFDVMGTIVYDPYLVELPAFFGLTFQELIHKKDREVWPRFERGEITEAEFLESYFLDGTGFDIDAFRAHMKSSYRYLDGMEDLLAELRVQGIPCHAMTNYPVWFQLIEESLSLSDYLDWTFVSCEMGVRKPNREIYTRAIEHLGLDASELLFVDDRQSNVEGAVECGLMGHRFEDAKSLSDALTKFGLL